MYTAVHSKIETEKGIVFFSLDGRLRTLPDCYQSGRDPVRYFRLIDTHISIDTILSIYRLRGFADTSIYIEGDICDISECFPIASGVVSSSLQTPRRT